MVITSIVVVSSATETSSAAPILTRREVQEVRLDRAGGLSPTGIVPEAGGRVASDARTRRGRSRRPAGRAATARFAGALRARPAGHAAGDGPPILRGAVADGALGRRGGELGAGGRGGRHAAA